MNSHPEISEGIHCVHVSNPELSQKRYFLHSKDLLVVSYELIYINHNSSESAGQKHPAKADQHFSCFLQLSCHNRAAPAAIVERVCEHPTSILPSSSAGLRTVLANTRARSTFTSRADHIPHAGKAINAESQSTNEPPV